MVDENVDQFRNLFKPTPFDKQPFNYNSFNSLNNNNLNYDNLNYNNNPNYNNLNFNYNSNNYKRKTIPKIINYRSRPDYFSYQTIEQKPFKNDVQFKFEDVNQLDKIPMYIEKTIDQHMKKIKDKQQRIDIKQKKLVNLRKPDEIRKLEKLRYRLQAIKVRIQDQIEELKMLEYRCRRKKLYFFDTMWKNTASILQNFDRDLDKQLCTIDSLLSDFTESFDKLEQIKKKSMASLDYGNSFYSVENLDAARGPSRESIEENLKEPRMTLEQIEERSNKLINVNNNRLDKIKIVIKDFKKEFKNKLKE